MASWQLQKESAQRKQEPSVRTRVASVERDHRSPGDRRRQTGIVAIAKEEREEEEVGTRKKEEWQLGRKSWTKSFLRISIGSLTELSVERRKGQALWILSKSEIDLQLPCRVPFLSIVNDSSCM